MPARTKGLLLALGALALLMVPCASAQDAKDDDLDKFLKKLDDADKPPPAAKGEDAKKSGEVSDKDKDLDQFLEKLGQTKEKAAPDEKKPPGPPQPGDEPQPPDPGKSKSGDGLTGRDKKTDEHLEELTGRIKKKKQQQQGDGSGPLSDVIKQMREVEERLGKPDTGEETRKKQEQIVKRLDQVIQQLRQQGSSSGKKKMVLVRQAGQQPGQRPPSEQAGNTGGNAPHTKPEKPDPKRSLFGNKDAWGHLPDQLREQMENVFKEEALPAREELIKRYYLSLTKKALTREE